MLENSGAYFSWFDIVPDKIVFKQGEGDEKVPTNAELEEQFMRWSFETVDLTVPTRCSAKNF